MRTVYLLVLFLVFQLHAFEDDDIDGVENSKDWCPNTSFEDLVDENGCPENQKYWGEVTLMLGVDNNRDESISTDYNFFSNYTYRNWDFSLYNSQQSAYDINNNLSQSTGDLYLSSGYTFSSDKITSKITFGTKIATGSESISTGENDYFTALSLSYLLNNQTALFSQLSYTLTGNNSSTIYDNPFGYSMGIGYMVNDAWYTALLYQRSNSIYVDSDDYHSFSFFNSYAFNKRFFTTFNYARGLDELSYEHTFSLKLGVNFE